LSSEKKGGFLKGNMIGDPDINIVQLLLLLAGSQLPTVQLPVVGTYIIETCLLLLY
jgi:hypothetical protein